jgi:hypothetical protein
VCRCGILFTPIVIWQFQCQEKYVRELSVTRVGYFRGAKPLLCHVGLGCPTGTVLHGENEVFQSNRNDFPKVSFTLDGI